MDVYGATVDKETRCIHYHGETDIVAIKFKCCGRYYPCYQCHDEEADHDRVVWSKEDYSKKAILCGKCGHECSIEDYMTHQKCLHCHALFNPNCRFHYDLYFEV